MMRTGTLRRGLEARGSEFLRSCPVSNSFPTFTSGWLRNSRGLQKDKFSSAATRAWTAHAVHVLLAPNLALAEGDNDMPSGTHLQGNGRFLPDRPLCPDRCQTVRLDLLERVASCIFADTYDQVSARSRQRDGGVVVVHEKIDPVLFDNQFISDVVLDTEHTSMFWLVIMSKHDTRGE